MSVSPAAATSVTVVVLDSVHAINAAHGKLFDTLLPVDLITQDKKLVSASVGDKIGGSERGAQSVCGDAYELIPGLMPVEGLHPDEAPGENLRPDAPTANLPLVFVGQATSTLTTNLTGKAALIQRDTHAVFWAGLRNA